MVSNVGTQLRAIYLTALIAAAFCMSTEPSSALVMKDESSKLSKSTGVPLYEWQDDAVAKPEKIVVAVHGFAQSASALSSIAQTFASQGYLVVAPDLRGHGRWKETDATMEENLNASSGDVAKNSVHFA